MFKPVCRVQKRALMSSVRKILKDTGSYLGAGTPAQRPAPTSTMRSLCWLLLRGFNHSTVRTARLINISAYSEDSYDAPLLSMASMTPACTPATRNARP